MKVNQHHALSTLKILLVPYSRHHVPTYHTWMQDPDLQAATASEPLTVDEEYAMQRSWREDHDKLTFIICLSLNDGQAPPSSRSPVRVGIDDAPQNMIGDINLFLFPPNDDEAHPPGTVIGEIELMIARKDLHRQGFGRAALFIMMGYIIFHWPTIYLEYTQGRQPTPWPPKAPNHHANVPASAEKRPELLYLRAKIQESNVGSISLFESVGFKRVSDEANYFGEVELRWKDDNGFLRRFKQMSFLHGKDWEAGAVPYDENTFGK